jgi:hypothetical protein
MTSVERSTHPAAAWVWALLSLIWWFASLGLSLPLASFVPALGGGPRWDLALVLAVNGAASLAGVWLLGRAVVRRPLRRPGIGLAVPVVGIALAIAVELALQAWAEARFGYYDSELIRLTAGLSPLVILTAVASFGVLVAPRGAIAAPLVGLVLAVAGVLFIVVSNVPGLADGIGPGSWALASLIGIAGAYALGAAAFGIRRARVGHRSDGFGRAEYG